MRLALCVFLVSGTGGSSSGRTTDYANLGSNPGSPSQSLSKLSLKLQTLTFLDLCEHKGVSLLIDLGSQCVTSGLSSIPLDASWR